MSIVISLGAPGRHTSAHVEFRARRAEADNRQLRADLHAALVRGCQDAMVIARLKEERAGLVAYNRELRDKTIRAKAEQERLRVAVVNARPRIREVDTQLVRPYSPVVVLPYVSPVPWRDTSNETTQQLPILDQPGHPAA